MKKTAQNAVDEAIPFPQRMAPSALFSLATEKKNKRRKG
jgi:hypothetical protein